MRLELIEAVLEQPTPEAIERMLEADDTVFWVDWREQEEDIVDGCESVLRTGALAGEVVEVDSDEGYEVYIVYREKRHKIPLTYDPADRHIALCTLNDVLRPDFEIRVSVDSSGGDSLAFLPMPADGWAALEARFGAVVEKHFRPLRDKPNLFTDPPEF